MAYQAPLVSCLMLTYGRIRSAAPLMQTLPEEAIESFLRQDYSRRELIIVNDTPGQRLSLALPHRSIKVINCQERFATLGAKRNFAVQQAQGDLLLTWDDDDISLPWRVSDFVLVQQNCGADYVTPQRWFFSSKNQLIKIDDGQHFGSMPACGYTRELAQRVPYREMNSGEDQRFLHDVLQSGAKTHAYGVFDKRVPYIYRWGHLAEHISGYSDKDGYEVIGAREPVLGDVVLRPAWQRDYARDVAHFARYNWERFEGDKDPQ